MEMTTYIQNWFVHLFKVPRICYWHDDISIKYHAQIYRDGMVFYRDFYVPFASGVSSKVKKTETSQLILIVIEEIIKNKLFSHPDYQEFVFYNDAFKNVVNNAN